MIIDIIKNPVLFEELKQYNRDISDVTANFKFSSTYDFSDGVISPWFNPANIRDLGLSRTYPNMDPCQYRKEYSLYLHCSNYLPLFLIDTLYSRGCSSGADPLIEDIGGGMGWLFAYLKRRGFNNFHLWDNFSQLSEQTAKYFISYRELNCVINDASLQPTIVNNVGVPGVLVRELNPNLELVTFYTNRELEKSASAYFPANGFSFLCKDTDDLAVAYCRNDKLVEFKQKLKPYAY